MLSHSLTGVLSVYCVRSAVSCRYRAGADSGAAVSLRAWRLAVSIRVDMDSSLDLD